ncbi:MAG TPA: MBL fold metallo-hydrolase [Acidimicrobiales bacterium]|nr:MBL fold metallo-hydrolase [Acidimicrobiales bacterium]
MTAQRELWSPLVDPYLSDAVGGTYGLHRQAPALLDPADVDADVILASHSHQDHLDPDSIDGFFAHRRTRFVGPPLAVAKVQAAGVDEERTTAVARGDVIELGDLRIRAVAADHVFAPEPVLDAVGYVLGAGEVSVYHSGDTQLDERIVADAQGLSLSLDPINGTAGNMGVRDAVQLVGRQQPTAAAPFHYGLWSDEDYGEGATLDSAVFVEQVNAVVPRCQVHVLEPDGPTVVGPSGVEVARSAGVA